MPLDTSALKAYKPLTFTGYPSCEDCLAWCEQGLAIAISENVHITEYVADNDQQSTTAVRIDLFNQQEWPEKPLATIRHLSIGEEQSYSLAVAVDWSPPGLGIHRRSVLTVLTSNLLLSIWETDGSPRNWRRSCVVNHHLLHAKSSDLEPDQPETGSARRCTRIRSFAWSHPLNASNTPKWGFQFLAVLDDQERVTIFQVDKSKKDQYGTWLMLPIHIFTLPNVPSSHQDVHGHTTELQRALTAGASVKSMKFLPWEADGLSADSFHPKALTKLAYQRYYQTVCCTARLEFEWDSATSTYLANHIQDEQTYREFVESIPTSSQQNSGIFHSLDEIPLWRESLKTLVSDFDKVNHLDGLHRLRFWGCATSPRKDVEAACVSLHPLDMHAYTSNVLEKCRIVFRPLPNSIASTHEQHKTPEEVLVNVLDVVVSYVFSNSNRLTQLDSRFMNVLHAWVVINEVSSEYKSILETAMKQIKDSELHPLNEAGAMQDVQTPLAHPPGRSSSPEVCDICNASISLAAKNYTSVCTNGHVFSRCNLSLLSIQEPGISKYCSQCKRQFLNLAKLQPPPGQCLITKLFHDFDVCPYCQALFRS